LTKFKEKDILESKIKCEGVNIMNYISMKVVIATVELLPIRKMEVP
jgi:hypothetical protein